MAASVYRLPDEPLPSGLSRYAVDPVWPLLSVMLAGSGFGLLWFGFNSLAIGSPTRRREWLCIGLSALGSPLLLFALLLCEQNGWLQGAQLRYAFLSILLLKLGMAYAVYLMQQRCFEIWEYYGGQPRNGLPLTILLAVVGRGALGAVQLPALLSVILQ
ncbi:putative membrane protein [Lysobacter antibioticus]|uniref:hypothetical protein n=1 Tax=Lysobacter antibioticus TaxID=84531 RepID=UPI00071733F0|nr:hypothetical protein [Lysobacter antibioticus]ALN64055.1 putative membrane protein [Lysobacter antibioticus]